jgi:hypothetical protein
MKDHPPRNRRFRSGVIGGLMALSVAALAIHSVAGTASAHASPTAATPSVVLTFASSAVQAEVVAVAAVIAACVMLLMAGNSLTKRASSVSRSGLVAAAGTPLGRPQNGAGGVPAPPGCSQLAWPDGGDGHGEPQSLERGIKVMMVGFTQSGKSTFLAAMWQYFSSEGASGIVLTTDRESEQRLDRVCHEILRGNLPAQSPATREWKFTVRAVGLSGNLVDVFTLSYVDYPGDELERLFELPDDNIREEPPDERVRTALEEYDIITGVLDGDKILDIMDGNLTAEYSTWLYKLFRLISTRGDKTVHLVLTKHDRLAGKYTLEQIVAKLRSQYMPFDQFCESQRTKHTRKRLIAVAALGTNGFITAQDGKPVLNPKVSWEYSDAERPIVCTLPDALEGELRKLDTAAPGFCASPTSGRLNWGVYPIAAWAAEAIASDIDMNFPLDHAIDFSVSATILMQLFRLVTRQIGTRQATTRPTVAGWIPGAVRIRGAGRALRGRTALAATSDRAMAMETIITEWSRRAQRIAEDKTACHILRPREDGHAS